MSATDNLGQQFVMVPTKTVGSWMSDDAKGGQGQVQAHRLMAAKRRDPQYAEVRDSIARNGIQKPLFASSLARPGPVLDDGHHRLAAAYELRHTHVPVTHWALKPHDIEGHL